MASGRARRLKPIAINLKDIINATRKMEKVHILGQVETFTKATTSTMKDMAMAE